MRAYLLFQTVPCGSPEARNGHAALAIMKASFGQIDDALAAGLYRHAASIMACGEEDVLARTRNMQGAAWQGREGILEVFEHAREMDVGDIIIDTENGDGWMRASIGWEALSWNRCERFLQIAAEKKLGKLGFWSGEPELELEPKLA